MYTDTERERVSQMIINCQKMQTETGVARKGRGKSGKINALKLNMSI